MVQKLSVVNKLNYEHSVKKLAFYLNSKALKYTSDAQQVSIGQTTCTVAMLALIANASNILFYS